MSEGGSVVFRVTLDNIMKKEESSELSRVISARDKRIFPEYGVVTRPFVIVFIALGVCVSYVEIYTTKEGVTEDGPLRGPNHDFLASASWVCPVAYANRPKR